MAARFALIFLAAVIIFQVMLLDAHVVRRDAPESTAKDDINEALQSFKSSLDDLVKNIQSNEFLQNVSTSLKAFGEKVQTQSQQLVEKIQTATKTD